MRPLALVTPWFGPDTRGGAEDQARLLVGALRRIGADIEVWTTTSRDSYADRTAHHYPPGLNEWQGIKVRRWGMDGPAMGVPPAVRKLGRALKRPLPEHPAHEINLLGSLPNSAGLYGHIVAHPE
ncbi:MAG TPA: hypothetical protein VD886_17585, partial [Herpetosiphonaceae bacterium]|nr:hypothetical protein [Herpetosiphonaceae bacterium]